MASRRAHARVTVMALAVVVGGCTEYSPIPPDWVIHRAEGTWLAESGEVPAGCERLTIDLVTAEQRTEETFRAGVPCATGTVTWSGRAHPLELRIGTPAKPDTALIWATSSDAAAEPASFAFTLGIAGAMADVEHVDPAHDLMFVEFADEPLAGNWMDRTITYVRVR